MGRAPCCSKAGLNRGSWTAREDALLTNYIRAHGEGNWRSLPQKAGLLRCGKSCRLRWMNYLRPGIKRGNIMPDEDDLIIRLHVLLGNRWSLIAGRLPGRTDNEIKNHWNTHLSKQLLSQGTDPNTHKKLLDPVQEPKRRCRRGNRERSQKNSESTSEARTAKSNQRPKVYLPRPTRVTSFVPISRSDSFESNGEGEPQSPGGEHGSGTEGVGVFPWSSLANGDDDAKGIDFLTGDCAADLINGSDLGCETHPNMVGNPLQKLYDEYRQLLDTGESS